MAAACSIGLLAFLSAKRTDEAAARERMNSSITVPPRVSSANVDVNSSGVLSGSHFPRRV
jgi:hypothetical protein